MSNSVKSLAEVQLDDHYIRVAREQFRNRLENGNSCSRRSSWSESILIRATQVDGRLENCWIDELSNNDTLKCSAQDGSNRNRSKSACSCGVAVLGTGVIDANFHCLGTVEEAIDLLNKRASGPQKTGAPSRKNHAGSKSIPVAVLRSLSRISNIRNPVMSSAVSVRLAAVSLCFGGW